MEWFLNIVKPEGSYFIVRPKRVLNLSIRPAVSTNCAIPVKNGCDLWEISNLTKGYSFPSSHTMVSFAAAQDGQINAYSLDMSLNTTNR